MTYSYPKFIIEKINNEKVLIIGKVHFHSDLAIENGNVVGGGWWKRVMLGNKIIFYGSSDLFGQATVEDIKECVKYGRIHRDSIDRPNIAEDFDFYYSYDNGYMADDSEPFEKVFQTKISDLHLHFALKNRFKNHLEKNEELVNALKIINKHL